MSESTVVFNIVEYFFKIIIILADTFPKTCPELVIGSYDLIILINHQKRDLRQVD